MICFVIALESEAKPVLDNMTDISAKTVHGKNVYCGLLSGERTGIVVCGVGKANAAAGAQYAIDCLNAEKIVNVGVAGGLNGGMKIAEIYCIAEAVQYDFDLVQLNGTQIGTLNEFDKPYVPLAVCREYPQRRLATGDRFNDDIKDFTLLTQTLEADIRDMEGGAIAQICAHADVPCYSFKAISDVAGSGSTTEQFSANLSACTDRLKEQITRIYEAVNG